MKLGQIKLGAAITAAVFEGAAARPIPNHTIADLIRRSEAESIPLPELAEQFASRLAEPAAPVLPINPPEVWACGCTYDYPGFKPRSSPAVALKEVDAQQVRQWVAAYGTPQEVALRSQIVLAAGAAVLCRKAWMACGKSLRGVVASRPAGRNRSSRLWKRHCATMTHWSCRLMAAAEGVGKFTVSNIWQSHHLKPHGVKTFKWSRDAKFLEKLTDVVGLYLNPPQKAIVL